MSHTVTAKLNKPARRFDNQAGSTFFVSLGEKNYDYKEKTGKWTNYEAALFAKDGQIGFYDSVLIEGAIITVNGSGIIIDDSDKNYPAKLILQDAKLNFVSDGKQSASSGSANQSQAPRQPAQQQPASSVGAPVDDSFSEIPFAPLDSRVY